MSITANADLEPIREFFRTWEGHVRRIDYASARELFDANVSGFGTHAAIMFGRDVLEREQWRNIWSRMTDFRFEVDKLHGAVSGDTAWAALPWTTTGFHEDGTTFHRPGRATVILKRSGGRWLGVHTHFSLAPGTPAKTYGPKGAR